MISFTGGIIGLIFFGVVPLISALTMEKWFWRLPLIGALERKRREWDPQPIWMPTTEMSIKDYRNHEDMGAKITITHHLTVIASEIKDSLVASQIRTFGLTALGVAFIAVVQVSQGTPILSPTPGGPPSEPREV